MVIVIERVFVRRISWRGFSTSASEQRVVEEARADLQ